jgi:hypothetical protein
MNSLLQFMKSMKKTHHFIFFNSRAFPRHWRTPGVVEMGRDLSPGPALPLDSPPIGGMETG